MSDRAILPPPQFIELSGSVPTMANLAKSAASHLRELANEIEVTPAHSDYRVWEMAFADLSFRTAFQMGYSFGLALGKNCQSIYSLHVVDGPDAETILHDLHAVRAKKTANYPRPGSIDECRDSSTLYVGSSKKTSQRLQEHLGTCAPGTYGLRLGQWASHWPGKVRIEVRKFQGIDPLHLQLLEDHLALLLRPITGKRGGR